MTCKVFDKVCQKFSKKTNMAYFNQDSAKDKRAFFLDEETGEIRCMILSYRKLSYHPHTSIDPVTAAKHGRLVGTFKPKVHIGDVFYYDELAEDVYYGEFAVEAAYRELGM